MCSVNFIISWNAVNSSSACGTVLYNVTILPDDDGVMMMRITDTSYNITGVTPNTRYNVNVSSRNDAGMGQSNMIIVTTPNMTNDPIGNLYYHCAFRGGSILTKSRFHSGTWTL